MAYFMVQVAYTAEAWMSLMKHPKDRTEVVRPMIEKLGGTLESAWFAFGDYDVVVIMQLPDNVSAAAFSLAVSAGGAVKAFKTTPMMTIEEGIRAMKKAGGLKYRPPDT